ncbi:family 16 glycosylhydrolase [Naumannella sp. ID2617S]|nr:family 16 glycosylhydrolase [Naumannella sp. ID2617S]
MLLTSLLATSIGAFASAAPTPTPTRPTSATPPAAAARATVMPRPTYSLANGDEFDQAGLSTGYRIYAETRAKGGLKGKSLFRPENVTLHDGYLDLRTSRHCVLPGEEPTEANVNEQVCPAGTATTYTTGRIETMFYPYKAPRVMEVRAKLDGAHGDHNGITSTAWANNANMFCGDNGTTNSDIAELDTMEVWDSSYNQSTTHLACRNGQVATRGTRLNTPTVGDWHTWRVEYDGHSIRYFFDGRPMPLMAPHSGTALTADLVGLSPTEFNRVITGQPWMTVIYNTVNAAGGWAPATDDNLPFQTKHDLFDYLRWQDFDPTAPGCAPAGAIGQAYANARHLGTATSCERDTEVGGGRVQNFEGGRIYWRSDAGAVVVLGAIVQKYLAAGAERLLGLPRGAEFCGLRDGGCAQIFERGLIYWSPNSGAHWIRGAIFAKYGDLGWERSFLGYPTSDENCGLRDGGCYQSFQGGLLYWSPASGAHFTRGLIQQRYAAMGGESGVFGYPMTDELCGDRGCFQRFQRENGHIYWSPASGAWGVQGLIYARWASTGYENGRLGYPVGPEVCSNLPDARECVQDYQGGRIVWNSRRGIAG